MDAGNAGKESMSLMEKRLLEKQALQEGLARQRRLGKREEFLYDATQAKFWDRVNKVPMEEDAVNAMIPMDQWTEIVNEEDENAPRKRGRPRKKVTKVKPTQEIKRVENGLVVESSTWAPGEPEIIEDHHFNSDGMVYSKGGRAYNTYREASIVGEVKPGITAQPWVDHVKKLYPNPEEHEHFFNICAHMVQKPGEKCNTAVIFSGEQGIGKDALLGILKEVVGHHNAKNIDPDDLFGAYRTFLQAVLLVIDEVRSAKDERLSTFYNLLKPIIAAPPDTLAVNDKYIRVRYIRNVVRVMITTNELNRIFIPMGDRRMFVLDSPLPKGWHLLEGDPDYFKRYWQWAEDGGTIAVQRWLAERDISKFDPKATPPSTEAHRRVMASWDASNMEDALTTWVEKAGNPDIIISSELVRPELGSFQFDSTDELAGLIRSPRKLIHRMNDLGYDLFPIIGKKVRNFNGPKGRLQAKMIFARRCMDLQGKPLDFHVAQHGRRKVGAIDDEGKF